MVIQGVQRKPAGPPLRLGGSARRPSHQGEYQRRYDNSGALKENRNGLSAHHIEPARRHAIARRPGRNIREERGVCAGHENLRAQRDEPRE